MSHLIDDEDMYMTRNVEEDAALLEVDNHTDCFVCGEPACRKDRVVGIYNLCHRPECSMDLENYLQDEEDE